MTLDPARKRKKCKTVLLVVVEIVVTAVTTGVVEYLERQKLQSKFSKMLFKKCFEELDITPHILPGDH